MLNQFSRTQLLLGEEGMNRLANARVAVFGIGGVGGYVVEALVRSGVGTIDIFDDDKVCLTNINRQIIATRNTIGKYKVDVMKERALSINPNVVINAHKCFYMPSNADEYDFSEYDYVVDAIDTVTGKIEIIMRAKALEIPVISCMGAGNKLDATKFEVSDIYDTEMCPLARTMRREMKKRGVKKLKVVYSKEQPISPIRDMQTCGSDSASPLDTARQGAARRAVPGSTAFVPAVAGLIAAGEVIKDLAGG
ncbi:MAG: tRNA threonylcarbamoyladenosine dehydratase [Oscillospiraceae bacterium]|nr:tRNA threonylcarbamoyladenosine dehydratase [Oscillospiraceae bacterium]